MKTKPIYVEIPIQVPIQRVWDASQEPDLHAQWDLRFSSISYLPKNEEEPQFFTYTRKAGPFLTVEGWGKSSGSQQLKNGVTKLGTSFRNGSESIAYTGRTRLLEVRADREWD